MMRTRDFLRWYARSSLGISMILLAVSLGVFLGIMGVHPALAVAAGAVVFSLASAASFAAGAGAKAAVREREREAKEALDLSLSEAQRLRDRIVSLRVPDPDVSKAVQGFALAFGEYLEACRREGARDPRADEAAAETLEALTVFLKELDGTAVERRFDLPDADPFPDAKGRTLAYIKERTEYVRTRRMGVDGGLGGGDALSIREDLR